MATTTSEKKRCKGRQKIPISHIIDKSKRYVAFSRRRTGLFKKAAELSTLTGSSIGILTFSGAGKAFSFGSPNADAIIQRYLTDVQSTEGKSNRAPAASQYYFNDHDGDDFSSWTNNYNGDYQDLAMKQVDKEEAEKHMSGGLMITEVDSGDRGCGDDNRYGSNGGDDGGKTESLFWWEKAVDENLGLDELEEYMMCLERLKTNVAMKADQLAMMNTYYYDEVADLFLPNWIDDSLGFVDELLQDCSSAPQS